MAHQVTWSSKAVEDVDAIASYIARDSVSFAAAVVSKILEATQIIVEFPLKGRIVPEFEDDNIREQFAYSYRIIYRIQQETVTIIAVIYGKKLLELEA